MKIILLLLLILVLSIYNSYSFISNYPKLNIVKKSSHSLFVTIDFIKEAEEFGIPNEKLPFYLKVKL